MLVFHPAKRIEVDEALNSPYFADIRDHNKEISANVPADFEFEYIEDITADQLRQYFVSEIRRYQ